MIRMKPIETRAYGYRFRSRLEARYAVLMTELGVRWYYELEGFQLPSGYYLPDFFLPDVNGGSWLEIKPHSVAQEDRRHVDFWDLILESKNNFFIVRGLPSSHYLSNDSPDYEEEGHLDGYDDTYRWCVCGCGRTPGIEFDGRGDRIDCKHYDCVKSPHGDKGYSHNHPRIIQAVIAARSARFEHGEQP